MERKQQDAFRIADGNAAGTEDRDRTVPSPVAQNARPCEGTPLSCAAIELLALRFRILSEPMRVRLLGELRDGEMCVSDLVAALGTAQPNISRHLHVLEQAGILGHRRAGNLVYYFVADESVLRLVGG